MSVSVNLFWPKDITVSKGNDRPDVTWFTITSVDGDAISVFTDLDSMIGLGQELIKKAEEMKNDQS